MNESSKTSDVMRAVLVAVATIATIAFNALASTGRINGVMTNEVSDKYPTVVTPAGYAFTIWALIYFGLIAFSIYQLLPTKLAQFRNVRTLYIISCVLNCAWLYFWHRFSIGICVVLIFAFVATLALINIRLKDAASIRDAVFTKATFGIYFGWVTVASIVNLVIYLKYIDVQMSASSWNLFGIILIILATLIALVVRVKLRNFFYPLAVAWAVTGIALQQSGNTAVILTAALSLIICLVLSISFVMDLRSTTHE